MADWFRVTGSVLHVDIKAIPGASKTEIAGVSNGRLRVRAAAAPENGRANAELLGFLAKALGCAKREVTLLCGEKSRFKTASVPAECQSKLEALIENIAQR